MIDALCPCIFIGLRMKFFCIFSLLLFSFMLNANDLAQNNPATPTRTPEQEAVMQTQKMQQELNLDKEQTQAIYEINLRHARERQVSNSRSQALERVKNKDAEVKQVLTRDQYNRLQEKKYDRYPSGSSSFQHNLPQTGTLQRRTVPAGSQRSEAIQKRIATPLEKAGRSTPQRRAVQPSERADRQAVPKSAQPANPTRSVLPERRSAVPQANPSPSQNRNSRPGVSPSQQPKETGRPPARR
jgi:Spy/CpxP family protein refolding chaperone